MWERNLIKKFKENTNAVPLLHFLTNKSDSLITKDGSETTTKNSGEWVTATKDGTNIIRESNPDYGTDRVNVILS